MTILLVKINIKQQVMRNAAAFCRAVACLIKKYCSVPGFDMVAVLRMQQSGIREAARIKKYSGFHCLSAKLAR